MPDIRANVAAAFIAEETRSLMAGIDVLAVFERYVYLSTRDAAEPTVLVVTRSDGALGPLGVILEEWPDWTASRGVEGALRHGLVQLGDIRIDLTTARLRPSVAPRPKRTKAAAALGRVVEMVRETPSGSGFLTDLVLRPDALSARTAELGEGLAERNSARLVAGAERLAGLGEGLTPAGDDFLCGAMTAAWAFADDPPVLCRPVLATSRPLTTTLSGAFLAAAARGHVNEAWRNFLLLLSDDAPGSASRRSLDEILAFGASSGADTLAGFLWATRTFLRSPAR